MSRVRHHFERDMVLVYFDGRYRVHIGKLYDRMVWKPQKVFRGTMSECMRRWEVLEERGIHPVEEGWDT